MPDHNRQQTLIKIFEPAATRTYPDPKYYSTHPFMLFNPFHAATWFRTIGLENTSSIRSLYIGIPSVYNLGPSDTSAGTPPSGPAWVGLFNYLSYFATGLKEVTVHWDADGQYLGGGTDWEVVMAIAGLRGLERIELGGFYLESWVGYLEGVLGVMVGDGKEKRKAEYWIELDRWRRAYEGVKAAPPTFLGNSTCSKSVRERLLAVKTYV